MTTLSLISTAIVISTVIGIPVGYGARSTSAYGRLCGQSDIMQTTPTFVYLVPVVMLFGVGTVPGEVAVVIAAAPAAHPIHQSRYSHGRDGKWVKRGSPLVQTGASSSGKSSFR